MTVCPHCKNYLPDLPQTPAWQPIETAPKDGTRIIVYRPKFDGNYIPQVGADHWRTQGYYSDCWGNSRSDCQPTLWMPFPEAPK